jgi:uncharacterized glyoxalase superfamily protein PhnB
MSADRRVSSQVEVPGDPQTAFRVFTEEMDLWWVRGPINFFDAARAVAVVCEQGVGGRILEVYDQAAGDVLEMARITAWEPGRRLAWNSSVDEVRIEVLFDAVSDGTRVRVNATIHGEDRGGTAWLRVIPPWFGAWWARRDGAAREPRELARLAVAVYYAKPVAAARWLVSAFGLTPTSPLPESDNGERSWIEFHVGNCSLIVFQRDTAVPTEADTHVPWLFVDDLDAHYEQAVAHGAVITEPIRQHGFRAYTARDPEGYRWTIAQARPGMR